MSAPFPVLPVKLAPGPIPAVVHQVWVGGEPPAWVRPLWDRWDGYAAAQHIEIRRWTDANTEHTLSYRLMEQFHLTPVQMSDFLRLEVMAMQGGVYMDSDTYPLLPLREAYGEMPAWFAHGQDYIKSGAPTVSNAMMGFPQGHPFLSDLFDHGVRALRRGVKNTFDIVGPAAIRRELDKVILASAATEIVVAPAKAFPAYRKADKKVEADLGRPLTQDELQKRFPNALVVHRSAVSWVA